MVLLVQNGLPVVCWNWYVSSVKVLCVPYGLVKYLHSPEGEQPALGAPLTAFVKESCFYFQTWIKTVPHDFRKMFGKIVFGKLKSRGGVIGDFTSLLHFGWLDVSVVMFFAGWYCQNWKLVEYSRMWWCGTGDFFEIWMFYVSEF